MKELEVNKLSETEQQKTSVQKELEVNTAV